MVINVWSLCINTEAQKFTDHTDRETLQQFTRTLLNKILCFWTSSFPPAPRLMWRFCLGANSYHSGEKCSRFLLTSQVTNAAGIIGPLFSTLSCSSCCCRPPKCIFVIFSLEEIALRSHSLVVWEIAAGKQRGKSHGMFGSVVDEQQEAHSH